MHLRPSHRKFVSAAVFAFAAAVLAGGPAYCVEPATVSKLIEQGNAEWTAGRLVSAQTAYEAAIERDPRSVDARMKLAGLLLAQQKFGAGAKEFQRVIGIDPGSDKAYVGLGIAYLHSGDRELSRAALEEALRINPGREEQLRPILERLR